eukprot:TRINITY_DN32231_c0_g1_i1.p1 TRINITY_DN32231_c0_g1~~TRINITY_DN32231_c0_g1_i1.p1  ORF type:complete len:118 (+),score=22.17 TRINITY_DN32231_c0_g1_i1:79-432(+)
MDEDEDMSIPLGSAARGNDNDVSLSPSRRPKEGSTKPQRSMAPPRREPPRRHDYDYDYYDRYNEYPPDEPFRWSEAWGLICGLILLVFIIAVLTWAYLEDLREARELEEAKARGVEL